LLQDLAGSEHLVLGSDFPFAPEIVTANSIYHLGEYEGVDDSKREAVYGKNMVELFPRFAI